MAQWNFTIEGGTALREAIYNDDPRQTVECLHKCYQELYNKMLDEDKDYYQFYIEDAIESLNACDEEYYDEDYINHYLQEFYYICDDVRAFVAL